MHYQYRTEVFAVEMAGFFTREIRPECVELIERELNKLGAEGWELVSVFPFTNGGSPAQIKQAVHYFKRAVT
jgi:hypothetical protein